MAKYKVHKIELNLEEGQNMLEKFLNGLDGEVVSIIPGLKHAFSPMGAAANVKFLLIVEKLKK